eukprot:TRINITY_DN9635_c0_g5_i3.p1 TRINITY_DN9635_c0_g5~~TRINITY_DN9635_c0_g5_i3.p1  ORF type:complete len:123 (-),score=10.83 TRINITY_DN9635_c0_g5_i3:103-426(-)
MCIRDSCQTDHSAPLAAVLNRSLEIKSGSEPGEKQKEYEGTPTEDRLFEGIEGILREEAGRGGTTEEAGKDALYTIWGDVLIPLEKYCILQYLKGSLSFFGEHGLIS